MRLKSLMGGWAAVLMLAPAALASTDGGEIPDPAAEWDVLWNHLLWDIVTIGIIFAVIAVVWMFKYKAKSIDDVGSGPKLTTAQVWGWALIPAFVFMADDFYLAAQGWTVWNTYRRVPENALEIKVIGSQWDWEFDYGDDVTSEVLRVPAGRPVVLRMTSDDVIHSFFMPKYRVKEDMMPGRITYLWFLPKEGKALATCTEFCGNGHAEMFTDVIAVPPEEFNAWLETEKNLALAKKPAESQEVVERAPSENPMVTAKADERGNE